MLYTQFVLHDEIFDTVLYYTSGAALYFVIFIGVFRQSDGSDFFSRCCPRKVIQKQSK